MNKKIILVLLCVFTMVAASVFGTLAYLTDTDSAINTFTVGKISILLDEADVKTDGTLDTENRVKANEYHLLPGHTYIKDPTVTVEGDSENAYIRMMVEVERIDQLKAALTDAKYYYNGDTDGMFLLQLLCDGWDSATWEMSGYTQSADGKTGTYEFRYAEVVAKSSTDTKLPALFQSITVPGEVDNAGIKLLDDVVINVVAHAIQADGFGSADLAWAEFPANP